SRPPTRRSSAARPSSAASTAPGARAASPARTVRRGIIMASAYRPLRRIAAHAALRGGDGNAGLGVLLQLVAQGANGDAQDGGRVGAVAEAVGEGVQDQLLFHRRHRLADERA